MAAFDLQTLIGYWQDLGVFSVALPFLLIFTVVFAVLQKAHIFGDDKKVHAIIALVVGLISVTNEFVMAKINAFLPNVSLLIVIILMFLLLLGSLAPGAVATIAGGWAMGIAGVFVLWALIADFVGPNVGLSNWWYGFSNEAKATAIFIAIIVAVVALFAFGGSRGQAEGETGPKPPKGGHH